MNGLIKFFISLIPISIYLYYVNLTKTKHYKLWVGWCKTHKNSKFKEMLVLFKVVYPPSFDWYVHEQKIMELSEGVIND